METLFYINVLKLSGNYTVTCLTVLSGVWVMSRTAKEIRTIQTKTCLHEVKVFQLQQKDSSSFLNLLPERTENVREDESEELSWTQPGGLMHKGPVRPLITTNVCSVNASIVWGEINTDGTHSPNPTQKTRSHPLISNNEAFSAALSSADAVSF